jgi:hypothetical protein
MRISSPAIVASFVLPATSVAQESDADALAKALANPVSSLISVPFQYNYDESWGDDDGYRNTLNIQPVVPVSISEDWNLISRTILPIIDQNDVLPGTDQSGFGDTLESAFLSPKEPTASGLIWGVGPAVLIPTGTGDLSTDSWAIGPTGVVLKQQGVWTYGALINHLVDVGGAGRRVDINRTFVQPFLVRSIGSGRTITLNTESTYDRENDQWTVPINLAFTKVARLGNQAVSFQAGARGYVEAPDDDPEWGLRFTFTLLYPR